ncbi:MAG: hypothetical protein FRX49_09856, partial [Trebouxia sp. A1-2]
VLKKGISAGSFTSYKSALPDSPSSLLALDEDPKTIAVVKAFKLQSAAQLKVVLSAMILSECVYKLVDVGPADSAKAASTFVSQLPPGFVSLQHMQSVAASVPHSCLSIKATAVAHRGFLARARGIPVEALYAHAKRQGRRLVLCGHSLGGAVALLCALRLLQGLPRGDPSLYCICFGTPAIGNAALAALVAEYGWESHILNFILPEDIIPRILALPAVPNKVQPASLEQQQQHGTASASAQASLSMSASAQVPMTVRNRLQNLRAILTAKTPSMQQLATATDQQAQPADGKPAMQVPSLDEPLQAASSLLSGNSPATSDRKKPSQTVSDQESGFKQQSSRLQALRAAIAARWPSNQQKQPALDLDAEVEQDRTGKTERQLKPATVSQQDKAAVSAANTGTDVPPSPSGLFHSLRGRLQRQSAKQVTGREAEPAASSNPDHVVNPPQDDQPSVSSPEGTEQIAAEQAESGKPVFQGIRSFTSRLPGVNRAQPGTLSPALPPDPGTQPNADSHPALAQPASADELDLAHQQQQVPDTKQPSALWGLNRVQGAWEGASSRVKAMRALLPAYPAYAHIGSHQILLPASPAMTEAVKSAQQKGLAEERQQALIMHRMSAYRGRAIAICRSVFHWEPMESATQICLSTTLSPPVTLFHATVIIPPLPLLPTNSSTPAEALTQPASQAVSDRQSVRLLVQSDQQPSTGSSQQHQGTSPQQEVNQQLVNQSVEQVQQQRQPAASAKRKLPRLGSGAMQLDPDTAAQEQDAPMQAAKHKSPNRQRQREQQVQSVDRPNGSSGQQQAPPRDEAAKQDLPIMQQQQQPPAMLLRIETDFVCKEQAVHVQLPVVWVLGDDTKASQAIWQLLTSAKQQSGAHAQQQGGDRTMEPDGKKPDSRWQAAQTRLRAALTGSRRQRDPAEQHPRPQLVTAVMSGIRYALIRPTRKINCNYLPGLYSSLGLALYSINNIRLA